MTFTPNIPASGQSLGNSRTQVLGNFSNYNNVVSQDHVAPNASGQGKHKQSTYTELSLDATTLANEIAVYCKDVSGVSRLFQRLESNGTVIPFSPIFTTNVIVVNTTNQTQYSLSFGGMRITFGSCRDAAGFPTNTTVPFAVNFAVGNVPSVLLTIEDPNATSRTLNVTSTPTNAAFSIKVSTSNVSFSYVALGLP